MLLETQTGLWDATFLELRLQLGHLQGGVLSHLQWGWLNAIGCADNFKNIALIDLDSSEVDACSRMAI
ncbi:hypothetical protein N7474_002001 [Penicillium riverlandense]|uniref:uncharacterized protein n=1 Tax=Penicillium riverlandense TaxID=1903569 RepID=UPI00254914DA|nr:uncharacterized protein N7474_002001 [Penicillium riverlandense]KAJ5833690.1 hypothetical protein N7474_002001 [Penicillium riverlandense]